MQLVELQGVHAELERAGYAVVGITYDPQAGLKTFAEQHRIDYPLLSDDGSRVIRELGILDEDWEGITRGSAFRHERISTASLTR